MLRADRGTHAKAVIINDTVILSSANFDPRSLNLNSESGVIIYDAAVAQVYRASIQARMTTSLPVILKDQKATPVADEFKSTEMTTIQALAKLSPIKLAACVWLLHAPLSAKICSMCVRVSSPRQSNRERVQPNHATRRHL